jgi:murein DD-endopeptidase MepM/ murein hydrolase activator NlpD
VKTDGVAPAAGQLAHAARDPQAKPAAKDAQVAAKQLESFFLRQMLTEARPQGGGMLDGGFAGDTFKQMLDEAIADKMTAAGGVGMTQIFARQLDKGNEVAGAVATPIANAPLDPTRAQPAAVAGLHDPSIEGAPRFMLPLAGRPSSGYGLRADPMHGGAMINHPGFDLAATTGTPVAAAAGGTVVHAGPAGTYGNLVTLRHDNGFETRYAHLSSVDVKVGDRVEAGSGLGKVGSTGYSTGPHLHFEVRHDGKAIDPAPLLPLNSSLVRTTR